MPLTTRNADQMINSQEDLKLFMGQLVNAFFTVQGAKGKKDEDLDRLSNAVQKKFNDWNKLDDRDFSLPEIRRELKNEVLLPIETYLDKFKRPVEVRQQLRPLELSLREAQEKVQEAEETYEEIEKKDTPRRVAQMGKINQLYRTELVPAETAYNKVLKDWEDHPDNKQAQLRRELEKPELFGKYTAHVGDGPNLRLRTPKTAAESLKLGNDYLYGLGNSIQAHSSGPNTLHSSMRGGVDPELRAILTELSSQDLSDYARSVHASGGEYDASKDPVWAAVRRFSGWMERNYGTTLHQNILEVMDRTTRPADLIDYSAPTYGRNNMPEARAYKRRETTPELFSKGTLEAAPAGIGEKLSGKDVSEKDRVYHETQLYGAFSKVLRDAEAKAAGERLGFARVPDQFKEERTLVKAADKLMTAPGERIERLESLDRQEKDIEELNAMTPEIRKSLENSRKQARAIAGDPKALFEGLSEVMHSPATDPQFLEILKESFMDNRSLFEAEKDFLPEGFMAELRKGAKDRGLPDVPAEEKKEEENLNRINIIEEEPKKEEPQNRINIIEEEPKKEEEKLEEEKLGEEKQEEDKKEEEKPAEEINNEKPDEDDYDGPLVEDSNDYEARRKREAGDNNVEPKVNEVELKINEVHNIPELPNNELENILNEPVKESGADQAGAAGKAPESRRSRLLGGLRSAANAREARTALENLLDGLGKVRTTVADTTGADMALESLKMDAMMYQESLDEVGTTTGKPLNEIQVPPIIRMNLNAFGAQLNDWCKKYPEKGQELDAGLESLAVPEELKKEEEKKEENKKPEENLNQINNNQEEVPQEERKPEENLNSINIINEGPKPEENQKRINIINDEKEKPKPSYVRTERGLLEDFPEIRTADQNRVFLEALKDILQIAQAKMQEEGALDKLSKEDRKFMHRHVDFGDRNDWLKDPWVNAVVTHVCEISGNGTVTIDGLLDRVNTELKWNSSKNGMLNKADMERASKTRYALNRMIQFGKDNVLKDFVRDGVRNYANHELQTVVTAYRKAPDRTGAVEKFGRIRTKEQMRSFFRTMKEATGAAVFNYQLDMQAKDFANAADKNVLFSEGGPFEDPAYAKELVKKVTEQAEILAEKDEELKKNKNKKSDPVKQSSILFGALEGVLNNELNNLRVDEGNGSLTAGEEMKVADLRRVYEHIVNGSLKDRRFRNYIGMYSRAQELQKDDAPEEKKPAGQKNYKTWQIEEDGQILTFRKGESGEIELLGEDGEVMIDTVIRDETGRRVFSKKASDYERLLYERLKNKESLGFVLEQSEKEDLKLLHDYNYAELRRRHFVPENGLNGEEAEAYVDHKPIKPARQANRPNVPPVNQRNVNVPPVNRPEIPPVIPRNNGDQKKGEVGLQELINQEKNGQKQGQKQGQQEEKKEEQKKEFRPAWVSPQEKTPKMKLGDTAEGNNMLTYLPHLKVNCEKLRLSMEKEKKFGKNSKLLRLKTWMLELEESAGNLLKEEDSSAATYANDLAKVTSAFHKITNLRERNVTKDNDLIRSIKVGLMDDIHAENESIGQKKPGRNVDLELEFADMSIAAVSKALHTEKDAALLKAADRALRPEYTDRLIAAAEHMKDLSKKPDKNTGPFLAFNEKLQAFASLAQNKDKDPEDPEGKKRKMRLAEAALQLRNAAAEYFNGRGVQKKTNNYENQQYNCGLYCLMLLDPDLAATLGRKAQGKYDMVDSFHMKYENIIHNEGELLKTYVPKYADKRKDPETTDDFRRLATQENVNSLVALYDMMKREDNTFHWRSPAYKTLMEKLADLRNANRHFLDEKDPQQVDAMAQRLKEVKEALEDYVPKHVGRRYHNDNRRFNISLSMQYLLAPRSARVNAAESQTRNPDLPGGFKLAGRNEKLNLDRLALCVIGAAKQKDWSYLQNERERKLNVNLKNMKELMQLNQKELQKEADNKKKAKQK